jgi:predicted DNA-binding protein (MmcQ/YjbR family)
MAKTDAVLAKMREICLSLPDTKETMTWGKPHFRVGEKIFAGCGEENGRQVIGFKLQMAHAEAVIKDARFWRAPYVGHKGWVSMDPVGVKDWDEVRAMILESFRLIAPRKTLAKLEGGVVSGAKKPTKEARATPTGSTAKTRRR